jgi:hypothetical protein
MKLEHLVSDGAESDTLLMLIMPRVTTGVHTRYMERRRHPVFFSELMERHLRVFAPSRTESLTNTSLGHPFAHSESQIARLPYIQQHAKCIASLEPPWSSLRA